MKVFISGSRSINEFDESVYSVLFDELNANAQILIGDAEGADVEVQKFCWVQQYENVTIYASDGKVRNNIGNYKVQNVPVNKSLHYKAFFTQKDIMMTDMADYGIVIWDGKSKGSLNNANRLIKQNKPCYIYLAPSKKWFIVETENALKDITVVQNESMQLTFF